LPCLTTRTNQESKNYNGYIQCYFSTKIGSEMHSDKKFGLRGGKGVSYTDASKEG
jgi:hypothetical protein